MAYTHSTQTTDDFPTRALLSVVRGFDLLGEVLRRRQIRRNYGRMSGAQLFDIGLTPYDIVVALCLPLGESAGNAVTRAAAREAARW